MTVVMDRTTTIRASLHDVEITLVIAMLLVILVVYFFLGNVRAMLIPGVAVPLSLLGTFGIMYLLGFTLDNLSLMALTISTGFVVDDAVVVLENISRHIEMGMKPFASCIRWCKRSWLYRIIHESLIDCCFYSHFINARNCRALIS